MFLVGGGGGAPLRNDVTDRRGKQILKANTKNKALSRRGGGVHPLHPPPRSAPDNGTTTCDTDHKID